MSEPLSAITALWGILRGLQNKDRSMQLHVCSLGFASMLQHLCADIPSLARSTLFVDRILAWSVICQTLATRRLLTRIASKPVWYILTGLIGFALSEAQLVSPLYSDFAHASWHVVAFDVVHAC